MKKLSLLAFVFISVNIFSLPIDWKGSLYVDYIALDNYRRSASCLGTSGNVGSQEILCIDDDQASFSSYIFQLNPEITLNDAVTIKGEISSGGARGGFFGDDFSGTQANSGALFFNGPSGSDSLSLNQLYAEIYSEKALIKVGRQPKDWGLGVIYNDGDQAQDRFISTFDGIELEFTFENFKLNPFFGRLDSGQLAVSDDDLTEQGVSVLYHLKERDFKAGVLFSNRSSDSGNSQGEIDLTQWNIFISKDWDKWSLGFEAPLINGDIGANSVEANSYILEGEYRLNARWQFNLKAGLVSGDDPNTSDNENIILHPNYNIAEILFTFNQQNISLNDQVFDQGVSNATFAHLGARYFIGSWIFKMALIYARATETFDDQNSDLGVEADLGLEYLWYPGVKFSFDLGYHAVGDFFTFTNGGGELELEDPILIKSGIVIEF